MSDNSKEIKITKKEKEDSKNLVKDIVYFSYNNIDYMYYKKKNKWIQTLWDWYLYIERWMER